MDQEVINQIQQAYKENNYKKGNLFDKVKAKHPDITKSQVAKFLKQDYATQLTQTQQKQEAKGHITATSPNELWQFDILDLSRYAQKNDGYRYLLACIDVFTRRAYVEPMKLKNADNCTEAFEKILNRAGASNKPSSLISDQDGSFLGGRFSEYLDKEKIILNTNALKDHHALGILDNFAYRIKNILTKGFLSDKNVKWLDKIQEIVNTYNSDTNRGLKGIAPNKADDDKLPPEEKPEAGESEEEKKQRELRNETRMTNHEKVFEMNVDKQLKNNQFASIQVGDKVRVTMMTGGALQKGTDPRWSDAVYKVESVKGNTVTLDNGKVYKRSALLRVPSDTEGTGTNVVEQTKAELRPLRKPQKPNPNRYKLKNMIKKALKNKKTEKKKPEPQKVEIATSSSQQPQYKNREETQAERIADLRRRLNDPKYHNVAKKTPEQIAEQEAQRKKRLAEQLKQKQEKEAKAKANIDEAVKKEMAKQLKQANKALGKYK